MNNNIIYIKSVEQFYDMLGQEKNKISGFGIIDLKNLEVPEAMNNLSVRCEFYSIMLNHTSANLKYGNKEYVQDSGLLTFVAPEQIISGSQETNSKNGWIINFSPKFLKNNTLLSKLSEFNFFSYDVNSAMSITKHEEEFLTNMVKHIEKELLHYDKFSKEIILNELGLLLHYCLRIQERELDIEHKDSPKDIIRVIDNLLVEYYNNDLQQSLGVPDISYLADKLNITKKHLSKLVRNSINIKTTDYINTFVINRAKHFLLSHPELNIKDISYKLGFSYPHYFNNVFKKTTGMTPLQYRE